MDEKKVREAIERMCKMRDMYNSTLCSLPPKTREKSEYNIYADYCKWCGQRLDWTES